MILTLLTAAVLAACGGANGGLDSAAPSASMETSFAAASTAALADPAGSAAMDAGVVSTPDQLEAALHSLKSSDVPPSTAAATGVPTSAGGLLAREPILVTAAPTAAAAPSPSLGNVLAPVNPPSTTPPAPNPNVTGAGGTPVPAASPSSTNVCGVTDLGGWTIPTPSARDAYVPLRGLQQPGSRLYYISGTTGSDATGDIYFWDGGRIIDSAGKAADSNGRAYGTDPMNPGASVKAFKRWAYVGPRSNATSDIGSRGAAGGPTAAFRAGMPDWWLFKRGETFDLGADLLSFARESNPAETSVTASLAVPGGRSTSERQIVGAYGDVCQPRPRFVHPSLAFVATYQAPYSPSLKNVAFLSLHFDGHDRAPGTNVVAVQLLGQTAASTDILFEDMWLDASNVSIGTKNAAQITFRRSLITDNFRTDGSHVQGIYYDGTREGRLRIEESILLRNGFSHGDPKAMAWPPTGTQIWDLYNRNMYISGETNSMQSGVFDSVSMMGASGDQFRPGARLERNFFYQGYVGMGAHGGYDDSAGSTGAILDNVLQRFAATGTNDNRGQPGWGFMLGGGANAVEVARNIVTNAQSAASFYGIQLQPVWQDCGVPNVSPTRANRIHSNIFDTSNATAAIAGVDGVPSGSCFSWTFRGVRGNTVSDNILVNSKLSESEYVPTGAAVGTTTDTAFRSNRVFVSRAAAAAALNWTGPDRTLKTYMLSRGIAVKSADGFPEYFQLATLQRRGQWQPDWTAKDLVNHVRAGFAMTPVATP